MKIEYKRAECNLPIVCLLKYFWLRLWFYWRRLLRCLRRCASNMMYWMLLLVPFALVSFAVLVLLCHSSILSVEDAVSVAVSAFLGSYLLLVIKDLWDTEATRHRMLVEQYNLYYGSVHEATTLLRKLVAACGLRIDNDSFDPYLSENLHEEYSRQIDRSDIASSVASEVELCGRKLIEAFSRLEGSMRGRMLIDSDGDALIDNFISTIDDIQDVVMAERLSDFSKMREALKGIVLSSYHIFACLRRPWRYPMDLRRSRMLENWLVSKNKVCA